MPKKCEKRLNEQCSKRHRIMRRHLGNYLPTMMKVIHQLLQPLKAERTLMLFCVLMSYVIALTALVTWGNIGAPLRYILPPLFDFYLICALTMLASKIRMGWLLRLLAVALLAGELYSVLFYHSFFSSYVLLVLLQTNAAESAEFLRSALKQSSFWWTLGITLLVAAVTYALSRRSRKSFKGKSVVVFLTFVAVVWSAVLQVVAYKKLYVVFNYHSIAECEDWTTKPRMTSPIVRLLYGIAFNAAMDKELDSVEEQVLNTRVDSCSFDTPLLILIIGESYNKYHAQIYNESYLPTTPRLSALKEKGNLCVFTDAVTSYNLTSFAFRSIFSMSASDEELTWQQYTLFPAIFKKAGYQVHLVSNQFLPNTETVVDLTGGAIFNRPKLAEAQLTSRNTQEHDYDIDIIQEFPPLDTLFHHPSLLIVHLKGSHVDYKDRYTEEFDVFKAEDALTTFGGKNGKQTEAEYANSILYNDFVVDSIFSVFKDQDAVAIYLADHGEEIYDWRDAFMRSGETDIPEVAHFQYEIPLMFYMTDRFMEGHPTLAKNIRIAAHRPFISSNIGQTMLYLAGITSPDYRDSLNILSPHYSPHVKRVIRDTADYDEVMKQYHHPTPVY